MKTKQVFIVLAVLLLSGCSLLHVAAKPQAKVADCPRVSIPKYLTKPLSVANPGFTAASTIADVVHFTVDLDSAVKMANVDRLMVEQINALNDELNKSCSIRVTP